MRGGGGGQGGVDGGVEKSVDRGEEIAGSATTQVSPCAHISTLKPRCAAILNCMARVGTIAH